MKYLILQLEDTQNKSARTAAFDRSPIRIGRNPLNDLQLEEGFVSQWHAVMRMSDNRTTLLDLGSRNATVIDGKPAQRNVEFEVDERSDIRIGTIRIHVIRTAQAPPELFARARKSAFSQDSSGGLSVAARTMMLNLNPNGGGEDRVGFLQTLAAIPPQELRNRFLASMVPPRPKASGQSSVPPEARSSVANQAQTCLGMPMPGRLPSASMPSRPPSSAPASGHPAPPEADPTANNAANSTTSSDEAAAGDSTDPSAQLEASYRSFTAAHGALLTQIKSRVEQLADEDRGPYIRKLIARFPLLAHGPELRQLLAQVGTDPAQSGVPEINDWLRRLTDGLYPPPGLDTNMALAMERVGELLEVFSEAFIEMRDGLDSFRKEMGLELRRDSSVLASTSQPRALLAYLLNREGTLSGRPAELAHAFADFRFHQVALSGAVLEGARELLAHLSPQSLVRADQLSRPARFLYRMLRLQEANGFRKLTRVYDDLVEEERFPHILFGPRFAHQYYRMMGDNVGD